MKPLIELDEGRRVPSLKFNFDKTIEGSDNHG